MTKRILSMLVVLCVILGMLPASVFALEPAVSSDTNRIETSVQVNPLYAGAVDTEELAIVERAEYAAMAEEEYVSEAEAAVKVRENLKNRAESFTVYVKLPNVTTDQDEILAVIMGLIETALDHTGDPIEGDYLKWQYGRWDASVQYSDAGGAMRMAITYTVEYYTTAQQEVELDQAVEKLMDQLDLDQVCDYEKIMGIYDYIIHHVVYDNEHVNNSAYKTQFTAYGALMDGTAVCQGYAVLFYRLALEYGIDARLIPGDSDGNGSTDHAWNIVKLDDRYYSLDATFDANVGEPYWFLRGSANFPKHDPDLELLGPDFFDRYPMSDEDRGVKVSEWVQTEAPTCTKSGTESKTCGDCGKTVSREIPALGHSWDAGTVTKEPSESETGIRTYTCSVCKGVREEEIPVLEHQHVYRGAVTEPTCTEKGYTTFTCACGDTYIDNEVPALGHTEVVDEAIAATCTEAGLTEGKHCSVCDVILVEQKAVPATGHSYEDGVCAVCGEKDPQATEPTTPSEPEETEPTVPSEPEETEPTTPSEPEETEPTTPSEPEETEPTTPSEPEEHTHTYGEWVAVKEPTSEADGLEERTCGCGNREVRVIPKLTNPFADVSKNSYYYESVLWAAHRGITSGISATRFAPNQACTRAQVVTFLWRAAGQPEPVKGENPFTDVSAGAYYYKAVLWAVEEGITSGMSKTQFMPNGACTRAQVVTFLWRAKEEPEVEKTENTFSDVNGDAYYYEAVLWAVENHITTGMGSGIFAPNNHCTRGQIVTFLHRAFTKA